jgi:Contractile injection system tube protein
MKITGYSDKEFQQPFSGDPYEFMINPETVKWQRSIEYAEEQVPDSSTSAQRYKYTPGDTLNFDVVIDCTGIVNDKRMDMTKEITSLTSIIFTYQGKIHRSNFVVISWGQRFIFKGVLTTFDTSFTLFSQDGTPLRAKISLGFKKYVSPSTQEKVNQKLSPDISHFVKLQDGMSLPQLCYKIWDDTAYCIHVAKYNKLDKFRKLSSGQKLIFPPIVQTTR